MVQRVGCGGPVTSADANRARIGGRFEDGDDGTPVDSPAWVAQRLGVTPATLRTWHHRYDLGPTGRTTGGHRRYSRGDLERLDRMRHLTADGIGVAEAARLSHQPPILPPHRRVPEHEDRSAHIAAPAARLEPARRGRRGPRSGRHRADRRRNTSRARRRPDVDRPDHPRPAPGRRTIRPLRRWHPVRARPVRVDPGRTRRRRPARPSLGPRAAGLVAAPDGEQHLLPYALAAGLAEMNRPSVLLGASVPAAALVAAAVRVAPAVIFRGSMTRPPPRVDLTGAPTATSRTGPALVLGGAGWPRRLPRWAASLADDLPAASHPPRPARPRPERQSPVLSA